MARIFPIFCRTMIFALTIYAQEPDNEEEAPPSHYNKVLKAHAIAGPLAFVVLFPLGAMAIRILRYRGSMWVHAGWMAITYTLVLASMGMGVWMAVVTEQLNTVHAIVGLVVVGSLLFQPVSGLVHHLRYKRSGRPNVATYPHIWWGRAIIALGAVNGGLGLQLSDNTVYGEVIYGCIAGLFWLVWMMVIVVAVFRSRTMQDGETSEKVLGSENRVDGNQAASA